MKVIIGSRVPPRVSMFEKRDGLGGYSRAMPPIVGDDGLIQAALLARDKPRKISDEQAATLFALLMLWAVGMLFIWWV